ncbi:MAG: lanthionine synthetase C family protein [Bacteroidota bacterium]
MKNQLIFETISNTVKSVNYDYGLHSGTGGIAMYFYVTSQCYNGKGIEECETIISSVIESLNNDKLDSTFCYGIAGFGWMLEYLIQKNYIDRNDLDVFPFIDEYLQKQKIEYVLNKNYDFLHGYTGVALYFFKRYKGTKECLPNIKEYLDFLDDIKIYDIKSDGFAWLAPVNNEDPIKVFNLSLSHGISSIIAILSKFVIDDIFIDKSKYLLTGSIKYLLNQKIENEKSVFFPNYIELDGTYSNQNRMAWCYGDLGVANSIYMAGLALNRRDLIDFSINIFSVIGEARKGIEESLVKDSCICHGTAGICLIYFHLYKKTNIKQFKNIALYWRNETDKMACHIDGLAGYKTYYPENYGGLKNNISFLEGICGVGIVNSVVDFDLDPDWDECLLLS